ncbi:uncharacterized protein LOC108669337 [Hyalella azteca]|uniref:Uncharacterized protein LOC108669337 n=1 Tax=Hyalella azteca TaxID=294128 RepID=A0A8B7NEU1_HYAAZ|nr:uncharacterized protein LOC108669337 [Hyalella azteca]
MAMEVELSGSSSSFEIVEPVNFYGEAGENSSSFSNIQSRLTYEAVVDLLTNTPDSKCTCWPPSKPKNGDIFIFTYEDEKHHFDFVADGMNWRNQGTRLYSKEGIVVKKRYYQRRIGKDAVDFRKNVFEISSLTRVLIHYFGPRDEDLPEAPHGNRKKHLDKGHVRVMPSVLADIKESKDNVGEIYMKMVAECKVPPQNFKVAMPRNIKQVENRKQYEKKHEGVEKVDVDEISSLLQLNTDLGGFVKYLSFVPCLNIVLINEQVLGDWSEMASSGERCLLSYVTRLRVRDIYISALIALNHQFSNEPGVPLAYLLHQRNSVSAYKLLLREVKDVAPAIDSENIFVVTERTPEVQDAWKEVIQNAPLFTCWESIKKTAFNHLKKLRVTGPERKTYIETLNSLMTSESEEEYMNHYEEFKHIWMHDFSAFYDTQLFDVIKSSIRGNLLLHDVYSEDRGIVAIECEGFNAVLLGLSNWNNPNLDGVTLSLYMLSCYYQKELDRGYKGDGPWRLNPGYEPRTRVLTDDAAMLEGVVDPDQIVQIVQNKVSSQPSV